MRYTASIPFLAAVLLAARVSHAQRIPTTVAEAEAEGAAYSRDPAPAVLPAAYEEFTGSIEQRCVSAADDTTRGVSWRAATSRRSGEMILRGRAPIAGPPGNKMLWMPLHDPGRNPATLLLRGTRLDHPSDTIRLTDSPARGPARQLGHPDSFGFPTSVVFPTAGRWLVAASTGHDWGCFLIDVSDQAAHTKSSR